MKEYLGYDRIVAFRGEKNDIDLFKLADESYAMEKAVDELKVIATGVIGRNNADGVAKWLNKTGADRRRRMKYQEVQAIAKKTMNYIQGVIMPGMALSEIRSLCEEKMRMLGADSFWYWDIGAFVFAGDETAVSVSGREYRTDGRRIEENDIITIDLSPQVGTTWGDYARTVILEEGKVVEGMNKVRNAEWRRGLEVEKGLHEELVYFAEPDTTFEQLYSHMNERIAESGFVNLDFAGNLGHSIVRKKEDRIYIEKGNTAQLGSADYFTFEPHIARKGSKHGFKREDIYYFDNGKLRTL